MKLRLILAFLPIFCIGNFAFGLESKQRPEYPESAFSLKLTKYERLSLFVIDKNYGKRFLKKAIHIKANDPLSLGDRKLLDSDYKGALKEYHKLLPLSNSRDSWQAQFNSMIANRKLGRFVDALINNESLIDSDIVPERIKAFALYNAAQIAYNDLYYGNVARKHALALKGNPEATEFLAAEIDRLLKVLHFKRETKRLSPDEKKVLASITSRIRKDHPRMFFNKETFPQVLEYLKRPRSQSYYQNVIKKTAAKVPADPKVWNGEKGLGRGEGNLYAQLPKPTMWGIEAASCALVYLVEDDLAYLEKAKMLLKLCGEAAVLSFECKVMAGDYYSEEMIYSFCAYDWIYNYLTPKERSEIIKPLLEYVYRCKTESHKFVTARNLPHEGGFYGVQMLKWFAGLAAIGDNIDEQTARKLLCEGYREHEVMLDIRDIHSGDDGGFISTANNYTMSTYPWTSFNYILTLESATGERSEKIKHLKYFPQWCVWNFINGHPQEIQGGRVIDYHDFGVGDTGNTLKTGYDVSLHMYETMHIFWDDPDVIKTCQSLMFQDPFKAAVRWPYTYRPLAPLLLYRAPLLPEEIDYERPFPTEHSRFFEEMGIVFMRSGSKKDDTYACFVTGKKYCAHRHYDANHFMIYKYDFLALDTGTRIGFGRRDNEHLNNYYCQTVAHNTILIHQPKEKLPDFWLVRKDQTYFNHGGQNITTGDICKAYETNDFYTYIAGDATSTYSPEKCSLALRQFVFVYPDIFVIADRVVSTKPEYRKEFVMHTQNEPVFDDSATWHADDGEGRMFCRTLLPLEFARNLIGGPGHEFEASGRNWELPDKAKKYMKKKNYLGRYRVEISQKKREASEVFLHVIQVGKDTLPEMVATRVVEKEKTLGVSFSTDKGDWEISFARDGAPDGSVRLENEGDILLDQNLRTCVQPQVGLGELKN